MPWNDRHIMDERVRFVARLLAAVIDELQRRDTIRLDRELYQRERMGTRSAHREEQLTPLLNEIQALREEGQPRYSMCRYCEDAILPHLPDAHGMQKNYLFDHVRKRRKKS